MSFQSTQNLNPVYNTLSVTESIQTNDLITNTFTATDFEATTIDTASLNATTVSATNGVFDNLTSGIQTATTINASGVITGATVNGTTMNASGVITGATVNATTMNASRVITGASVNGTTVNGTTVTATTVDCTNCTPDNLTLNAPITSTNVAQPTVNQLGYFVIQANTVVVPLTTTVQSVAVVTPADIPIGVYQVNARVQLSIDAGVTIDSLQIQI